MPSERPGLESPPVREGLGPDNERTALIGGEVKRSVSTAFLVLLEEVATVTKTSHSGKPRELSCAYGKWAIPAAEAVSAEGDDDALSFAGLECHTA